MVCTMIPIPKDDGFKRDAHVFKANIYGYAGSHLCVIVLKTAAKVKDVTKRRDWTEIYHAVRTHSD